MNTLQITPLAVRTTPPGPTGGSPPVDEASPAPANSKPKSAQLPPATSHAEQQERLAEARVNTAQAAAERQAQAEAAAEADSAPAPVTAFDRKIGLVDGTFKVFVDLVKPPADDAVFRVFGPTETPAPPPRASASASTAYGRAAANLPLKDVGIA